MFFSRWHPRQRGIRSNKSRGLRFELLQERLALTVSWDGGGDGRSWSDAANWDDDGIDRVPTNGDDVEITIAAGVVLNVNPPRLNSFTLDAPDATLSASKKTLVVDGSINLNRGAVSWTNSNIAGSGTLTNNVEFMARGESTISSTFVQNGVLTISNKLTMTTGLTNRGEIILDNAGIVDVLKMTVTNGTLTNEGRIVMKKGRGNRVIDADVINDGTIHLQDELTNFSKVNGTFINHGNLMIDEGATLSIDKDRVFTQADGTLTIGGRFRLKDNSFHFDGGSLEGNAPLLLGRSHLSFGPDSIGPGTFEMQTSNGSLRGDISAAQAVRIVGTGNPILVTSATGFTNHGTIILDHVPRVSPSDPKLSVTNGTLINAGTIISRKNSGNRVIDADVINDGTIHLQDELTNFSKVNGTFINHGNLMIDEGATLSIDKDRVFTQADGTLTIGGRFRLKDNSFHFDGGSLEGTPPLLLGRSHLIFGPDSKGAGTFDMQTENGILSGNISEAQTVRLVAANDVLVTSATGFTNHGTIILQNNSGLNGNPKLAVTSGPLTNIGTIVTTGGRGNRVIDAEVINHGQAAFYDSKTILTRKFTNATGGAVTGDGTVEFRGDFFGGGRVAPNTLFSEAVSVNPGPGILNFEGNYTQKLTHLDSTDLNIELGGKFAGTEYDQLIVGGNAVLSGVINVSTIDGFVPQPCDRFHVVNYGSRSGDDPTFMGLNLSDGTFLSPVFESTGLTLVALRDAISLRQNELTVAEGGFSDSYDVCLDVGSRPSETVTITPKYDDQIVVEPSSIVFDPSTDDWKTVKTFTVTAVDDEDLEGDQTVMITHTANSLDERFDTDSNANLAIEDVQVTIRDNDIPPDRFEPNDSFATASNLGAEDTLIDELTIHKTANDDWYKWTAPDHGNFAVDAFFDTQIGNLELRVYDAGENLLAWSSTTTHDEHVSVPVLKGETLYVQVFGFEGATHLDYQLAVHLNPIPEQIYVAHDQQVSLLDLTGTSLGNITDPLFDNGVLGDVEIGPNGLVYVALDGDPDTGRNGKILEFTPRGRRTRVFPLPDDCLDETCSSTNQFPFGFDVLEDGSVLIGQPDAEALWRVSAHAPPALVDPDDSDDPNQRRVTSPIDAIVARDGRVVWADSKNRGQRFINPSESGRYWVTYPEQHESRLFDSSGTQIDSRQSPQNALPIDAVELHDGSLLVLNQVPNEGNGQQGLLQHFDATGELLNDFDLTGTPQGLGVVNGTTPSRIPGLDSDGDGLLDIWETEGYDVNNDGMIDIDLPGMGAHKNHKDLFVEVDAMQGRAPLPLEQPIASVVEAGLATGTVLDRVVESFLKAGIRLHLHVDETDVRLKPFNTKWNEFSQIKNGQGRDGRAGRFGTLAQRINDNWSNIQVAKRTTFRYALFADRFGNTPLSGNAELPGNDFMITLGGWDTVGGTADQQAGTFMHELGHTLGLRHGGGDDINFKPNYLSVMNYYWQNPHPENTGWTLDFSDVVLPTLDERRLNEVAGVGAPQARSLVVGPLPFHSIMLSGPVDWNQNGVISADEPVAADVNRGFIDSNGDGLVNELDDSPGQLLHGHDDWSNLRFVFTDLQNFLEFRDGDKDRPEQPDRDPSDIYKVVDDEFEPNNTIDDSTVLQGNDAEIPAATISPGDTDDVDWYEWIAMYTGDLIAILNVLTEGVMFDLSLHDADGNLIEASDDPEEGTNEIRIQKRVVAGEKLLFRVSGEGFTGDYGLFIDGPEPGDVDGNGETDDRDIDQLCAAIAEDRADGLIDLNSDGGVNKLDFEHLVRNILGTDAGDANLDGRFNPSDLVQIFQIGEFEDRVPNNSLWHEGDWNCDREFDSGDLVAAFQVGSYTAEAEITTKDLLPAAERLVLHRNSIVALKPSRLAVIQLERQAQLRPYEPAHKRMLIFEQATDSRARIQVIGQTTDEVSFIQD